MSSRKFRGGLSTQPLAESYATSDPEAVVEVRRKRRKREANVYDAVAGRVTSTLPLDDVDDDDENENDNDSSDATATRHRHRRRQRQPAAPRNRRRDPILAPEEVLFRRIGAPVRFAEKDIYHAHEALPDEGRDVLPDSDMVKAVHNYASHYYSALAAASTTATTTRKPEDDGAASTPRGGERGGGRRGQERRRGEGGNNIDEQSMDETALLAFGILLEEAGREVLGQRGDLVFTEGVEVDEDDRPVDGDLLGPVGFLDARRWEQRRQSQGATAHRSKKKKKDEVHLDEVK